MAEPLKRDKKTSQIAAGKKIGAASAAGHFILPAPIF
jgi:hypothetical protein